MLHKKLNKVKKLVCVLVAITIAFSCFIISASAEDVDIRFDFGGFEVESVIIHFIDSNGNVMNNYPITVTYQGQQTIGGKSVHVVRAVRNGANFVTNYYRVSIAFEGRTYTQTAPFYFGSFKVGLPKNQGTVEYNNYDAPLPTNNVFLRIGNGDTQRATYSFIHDNFFEGVKVNYSQNEYGQSFIQYNNVFNFYSAGGSYFDFYLWDNEMKTYSTDEAAAQGIKENQDKNTDKILNGGSDEPHYSEFDDSAIVENDEATAELENQTEENRSSTISFFNNFPSLLNDNSIQTGLLATSKIYTELFSIKWLSDLVRMSLSIGAFAFVIGSVHLVFSRAGSEGNKARKQGGKKNA